MASQVWPVLHVHPDHWDDGLESARRAFAAGVAGVFVIQMDGDDAFTDAFAAELKQRYPAQKIGVNYLSRPADQAMARALELGLDATWTDSPGVSSAKVDLMAMQVAGMLMQRRDHLFFGSVAFKYQAAEPDPVGAAVRAQSLGMIPTTSGAATGKAANSDKVSSMSAGLGGDSLGLASGITPENVRSYLPYATHLLVATGIEDTFYLLDEDKLRRLMDAVAAA